MMQPHVQDLRVVDAEPAHLIGNSWGAIISLRLAMQHPSAVLPGPFDPRYLASSRIRSPPPIEVGGRCPE